MPLADFMRHQKQEERRLERELGAVDIDVSGRQLRRVHIESGTFEASTDEAIGELEVEAKHNTSVRVQMRSLPGHTRIRANHNANVIIHLT